MAGGCTGRSCIIEHARDSTQASPKLKDTCVIILTDIFDHTCLISNIFVHGVRQMKDARSMSTLHIVFDAGPHFRGHENVYHNCVTLVQRYNCEVITHWGCEKHMEGRVDRLFGWCRGWQGNRRDRGSQGCLRSWMERAPGAESKVPACGFPHFQSKEAEHDKAPGAIRVLDQKVLLSQLLA